MKKRGALLKRPCWTSRVNLKFRIVHAVFQCPKTSVAETSVAPRPGDGAHELRHGFLAPGKVVMMPQSMAPRRSLILDPGNTAGGGSLSCLKDKEQT